MFPWMNLWMLTWIFECQYETLSVNIKFWISKWKPRPIPKLAEFDKSSQNVRH